MQLHMTLAMCVALLCATVVTAQPGISVTVYNDARCSSDIQFTYYLNDDWSQCQALPASNGQFVIGHARCEDGQLIVEYCGNKTCSQVTCFGPTTAVASAGQCTSNLFLSSGSVKVKCPENTHREWIDQRPYIVAWVGAGAFFVTTIIFLILFCKARQSNDHIRV